MLWVIATCSKLQVMQNNSSSINDQQCELQYDIKEDIDV